MAGEWLKFECSLPEKPETLAITVAMGWDDPDLTVGKLMRLFRWFDQQTTDGNAASVTPALLDRLIGATGFVQAVADVGWLVIDSNGLSLHNFDRHNGATAKSRAQTAKRVANHRADAQSNADSNAPTVTPALAREEKRREEKEISPKAPKGSRRCPPDFEPSAELQAEMHAECPRIDLQAEFRTLRDHEFGKARSDWPAVYRNWMREATKRLRPINGTHHADVFAGAK